MGEPPRGRGVVTYSLGNKDVAMPLVVTLPHESGKRFFGAWKFNQSPALPLELDFAKPETSAGIRGGFLLSCKSCRTPSDKRKARLGFEFRESIDNH